MKIGIVIVSLNPLEIGSNCNEELRGVAPGYIVVSIPLKSGLIVILWMKMEKPYSECGCLNPLEIGSNCNRVLDR